MAVINDKVPTLGVEFAKEFCKALGVDPTNVKSVTVRVAVNEPMTLTVEKLVSNIAERRVNTVLLKHAFEVKSRITETIEGEDLDE